MGEWLAGAGNTSDSAMVYLDGSNGEELWRWQGGYSSDFCCANNVALTPAGDIVLGGLTLAAEDDDTDDEASKDVDIAVLLLQNPLAVTTPAPANDLQSLSGHVPSPHAILLSSVVLLCGLLVAIA